MKGMQKRLRAISKRIEPGKSEGYGSGRSDSLFGAPAQQCLELVSQPTLIEKSSILPVRPLCQRVMRGRKIAFQVVAAVVMMALLIVALLDIKGAFHFQQNQPAFVGTDAQLLQRLVQSRGTPTNIQQLLQRGQFTSVNLVSNIYNVHIQKVYADDNNVVLLYTVAASAWKSEREPVLTLETSSGQMLPETIELAGMGIESISKNKQIATLAYYDASVVQDNPTQLTLTVALSKGVSPSQEKIGEFTTPVHMDKTVVNVHQTASSNGQAFTLERVVMTPTEARFYYGYQGPLDSAALASGGTLSIARKSYAARPFPDDNSEEIYEWFRPTTARPHYVSFHETLLGQTGAWVFTENAVELESLYGWQFTFTVSY
jgi:hypothetical protein